MIAAAGPPRSLCRSATGLVDDLQLGEFDQPFLGKFSADTGLLGSAEGNVRRHIEVLVDPYRSGLDLARDLVGAGRIRRPDEAPRP
jgi:hypothetical protein